MEYVQLGRTGLRVSRVCLGMMSFGKHPDREWTLDESEAEPIVRRAVEGGTKVWGQTMPGQNGYGLSRKHILASIDESLARLELDYVDLYQIHRWD
jgi:aryl-alcohol dehydrogenase-like predicted oxidoreductase